MSYFTVSERKGAEIDAGQKSYETKLTVMSCICEQRNTNVNKLTNKLV